MLNQTAEETNLLFTPSDTIEAVKEAVDLLVWLRHVASVRKFIRMDVSYAHSGLTNHEDSPDLLIFGFGLLHVDHRPISPKLSVGFYIDLIERTLLECGWIVDSTPRPVVVVDALTFQPYRLRNFRRATVSA